jgi:hypothetical protein
MLQLFSQQMFYRFLWMDMYKWSLEIFQNIMVDQLLFKEVCWLYYNEGSIWLDDAFDKDLIPFQDLDWYLYIFVLRYLLFFEIHLYCDQENYNMLLKEDQIIQVIQLVLPYNVDQMD